MNAIIGLCHFCEAHGPRPLFCSYTTDDEKNTTKPTKCSLECNGCSSLGSETVFVSTDDDGTIYCSRETIPNDDIAMFLRQAAIRSITCEVNWNKEGGVVYFSDTRGHVLSLTFQLCDTRARGLKRWFSVVVLMKDKMYLLNIFPFLSEHMQEISKELQKLALVVFDDEQKVCSQRALRLNTGQNYFGQSRSLIQLTGDPDIFKKLHLQFTWMLKTGALTYSEKMYTSEDLIKKLDPQAGMTINSSIFGENACSIPDDTECTPLRALENLMTKPVFRVVIYCTFIGINIVIKTINIEPMAIVKGLARLVPVKKYSDMTRIRVSKDNEQIIPSGTVCLLQETENNNICAKWLGVLPSKCPTLMNRIENAISNTKLNDDVLHQQVKTLQLEWLGISKAIKCAMEASGSRSEAVKQLQSVFGMTEQDILLANYWLSNFL